MAKNINMVKCTWDVISGKNIQDTVSFLIDQQFQPSFENVRAETCVMLHRGPTCKSDDCLLQIGVNPACGLEIRTISVVSEARIIEIYGARQEYQETFHCELVDEFEGMLVYNADILLKFPASECFLKFKGLKGEKKEMWLYAVQVYMVTCHDTSLRSASRSNNISMDAVNKRVAETNNIPISEKAESFKNFLQMYQKMNETLIQEKLQERLVQQQHGSIGNVSLASGMAGPATAASIGLTSTFGDSTTALLASLDAQQALQTLQAMQEKQDTSRQGALPQDLTALVPLFEAALAKRSASPFVPPRVSYSGLLKNEMTGSFGSISQTGVYSQKNQTLVQEAGIQLAAGRPPSRLNVERNFDVEASWEDAMVESVLQQSIASNMGTPVSSVSIKNPLAAKLMDIPSQVSTGVQTPVSSGGHYGKLTPSFGIAKNQRRSSLQNQPAKNVVTKHHKLLQTDFAQNNSPKKQLKEMGIEANLQQELIQSHEVQDFVELRIQELEEKVFEKIDELEQKQSQKLELIIKLLQDMQGT